MHKHSLCHSKCKAQSNPAIARAWPISHCQPGIHRTSLSTPKERISKQQTSGTGKCPCLDAERISPYWWWHTSCLSGACACNLRLHANVIEQGPNQHYVLHKHSSFRYPFFVSMMSISTPVVDTYIGVQLFHLMYQAPTHEMRRTKNRYWSSRRIATAMFIPCMCQVRVKPSYLVLQLPKNQVMNSSVRWMPLYKHHPELTTSIIPFHANSMICERFTFGLETSICRHQNRQNQGGFSACGENLFQSRY